MGIFFLWTYCTRTDPFKGEYYTDTAWEYSFSGYIRHQQTHTKVRPVETPYTGGGLHRPRPACCTRTDPFKGEPYRHAVEKVMQDQHAVQNPTCMSGYSVDMLYKIRLLQRSVL